MSTPRTIICDLDGVLAEFNQSFWRTLVDVGAEMRPFEGPDPCTWDWPEVYGAAPAHTAAAWEIVHANPTWWQSLPKHRDFTREVENHIWNAAVWHTLSFVSARPANARRNSLYWLERYMGSAVKAQVVHTPIMKPRALAAMMPDAIIEDSLDNLKWCQALMQDGKMNPCDLILVDRAYNRENRPEGLIVVSSTEDALKRAMEGA